ncbi:MAG: histidine phosphatase family protein [Oscillatoriales cyanobacterium]|nr:MAG: histidine phosphatase family protein [Oscillatoriales cyanobacterium]
MVLGLLLSSIACGQQPKATAPSATASPAASAAASPATSPAASPATSPATEAMTPGEQANANFRDRLSGPELLAQLRKGGHIIYLRHAQTEKDYADQADAKMRLGDCETQRKLSKAGENQAQMIGKAFTAKGIAVDEVITSQYCRAWKTADLAFGRHRQDPKLNFLPFEDYTPEQMQTMKNNVMPLLTKSPKTGKNTVIVGHDDPFEAATGIYPDPQGMAYVLTPDGKGGFQLQANLLPNEWDKL